MGFVDTDVNNVNLDDDNFDEEMKMILKLLFLLDLLLGVTDKSNVKYVKKNKLMPIAWHPKGVWNWCMAKDTEKWIHLVQILVQFPNPSIRSKNYSSKFVSYFSIKFFSKKLFIPHENIFFLIPYDGC